MTVKELIEKHKANTHSIVKTKSISLFSHQPKLILSKSDFISLLLGLNNDNIFIYLKFLKLKPAIYRIRQYI